MKKVYIAFDLSRKTFYCWAIDEKGALVHRGQHPMTTAGVDACIEAVLTLAGDGVQLEFCFEAGTESHWVNAYLLDLGYETHPFHSTQFHWITKSKKKTDKKDAEKMARAFAGGLLPSKVELPRGETEEARRLLAERGYWLKLRTATGARLKALARKMGITYDCGSLREKKNRTALAEKFGETCKADVQRHLAAMDMFDEHITAIEAQYKESMSPDMRNLAARWDAIPGFGLIAVWMASAFLGDCRRFKDGRAAASYFGLVPRIYQSGDTNKQGNITKEGPRYGRSLLLEAAGALIRSKAFTRMKMYSWYLGVLKRRGKKKAKTALARKLVTIMVAMAKHGTAFTPDLLEQAA